MAYVVGRTRRCPSDVQGLPLVFLAPLFSSTARTTAAFPTSSPTAQRRIRRRDNNPDRGVSALRRTGLKYRVEMSSQPLPRPVTNPNKRSKVFVDPDHGLWGFFRDDKKALSTPEQTDAFGRPWVVEELRHKSWEDLHSLWWVCCKERNILATQEYERQRLKAGFGDAEMIDRDRAVRQTQKAIKHALTERYYAFEEARRVAAADQEINLEAEPGTQAYMPAYSDEGHLENDYPGPANAGGAA
ncbi:MAG: hypothetical protein L6R39_005882 [Caloplaca ligustica]|nr:MAG: hypothetical protein L6R39_005882 [Caloplaca ligustica]